MALLGGRTLTQITVREDANIKSLADLKGKKIGVLAFQDTTILQPARRDAQRWPEARRCERAGCRRCRRSSVDGISGDLNAISGVPEWTAGIQAAGVKVNVFEIEPVFPAMAQAILASDKILKEKPDMVKRFVRATLKGLKEVIDDPEQASKDYVAAVPQHAGKEKAMEDIMRRYAKLVYGPANANLGKFDEKRFGVGAEVLCRQPDRTDGGADQGNLHQRHDRKLMLVSCRGPSGPRHDTPTAVS